MYDMTNAREVTAADFTLVRQTCERAECPTWHYHVTAYTTGEYINISLSHITQDSGVHGMVWDPVDEEGNLDVLRWAYIMAHGVSRSVALLSDSHDEAIASLVQLWNELVRTHQYNQQQTATLPTEVSEEEIEAGLKAILEQG